jgi:hypothetical protein
MSKQEAQDFAQRLRRALERAGFRPSPTLVAHEFNQRYWGRSITPHTARSWLQGVSLPMQDKLKVLADWLQVSPQELRFGENAVKVRDAGGEFPALDLQEREMLKRYLTLPPEERKIVREVVVAMALASTIKARR